MLNILLNKLLLSILANYVHNKILNIPLNKLLLLILANYGLCRITSWFSSVSFSSALDFSSLPIYFHPFTVFLFHFFCPGCFLLLAFFVKPPYFVIFFLKMVSVPFFPSSYSNSSKPPFLFRNKFSTVYTHSGFITAL